MTLTHTAIPADFEVQPIDPDDPTAVSPCTCGTCGLTWDDGIITSWTPAPSARCPFEYYHDTPEDEDDDRDSCGSCGADLGPSTRFPWHLEDEDCRAIRQPLAEWAALLVITAAAVTSGELSQTERETLDTWILSKR